MIDFRYHLVSIIAIFMALAVGIVLGAGPLKEDIGTTLTSELTRARQDKVVLNDQLATARKDLAAAESYASATRATVLHDRLAGERVAVVVGPGADEHVVAGTESAVEEAGGAVTTVARLGDQWTRPGPGTQLGDLVDQAGSLGVDLEGVPAPQRAGVLLGRALATTSPGRGRTAQSQVPQALAALRDRGLVSLRGASTTPATLVVTVAGPMVRQGGEPTDGQLGAYLGLVQGLDTAADGSVLVSPSRPSDDKDRLSAAAVVSGVRADGPAAEAVSTVDDGDLSMGLVATVVALQDQQDGRSGRYGTGSDAEAVLPDLTR